MRIDPKFPLSGFCLFVYPACADRPRLLMKRTRLDGLPACAGIDLSTIPKSSSYSGLPRMRGDRPQPRLATRSWNRFTPHARGSTDPGALVLTAMLVYPACAGIDPLPQAIRPGSVRLPRMRGDRPCRLGGAGCVLKFTPHARGSTLLARAHEEAEEVYPACAGIDLVLAVKTYTEEVYPAWAGIDRSLILPPPSALCLPRMRGDRPVAVSFMSYSRVFTPHARGSTACEDFERRTSMVYPACAGIDPIDKIEKALAVSLPRMRGDRPFSVTGNGWQFPFTPHARGSTS